MRRQSISWVTLALFVAFTPLAASPLHQQELTPAPQGPFHADHHRIVDSTGRAFLMRGTQLTDFHPQTAAWDNRGEPDFGPHSPTTLTSIRLRFNMNTVRLPLDIAEADRPGYFAALAQVVRRANQLELLVILAAREPGSALPSPRSVEFWTRCAAAFKEYPNVMFEAFADPSPTAVPSGVDAHSAAGWEIWRTGMARVVEAIRAAGVAQPIVLTSWNDARMFEGAGDEPFVGDGNIVYGISPRYATTTTEAQREARFGVLARRAPVTANGWDLELADAAACAAIPSDPGAVSEMVRANLEDLDAREISWTMSVFTPGKLVKELVVEDATTLQNGWTCGPQKHPWVGLGRVLSGHLRATDERSIFVVGAAGGVDIPRGGFANGYGPVMAARNAQAHGPHLPLSLGGLAVQVTDSAGVARRAGLFWVSAGWGQVNFVVPEESALGLARVTLLRGDGSRLSTHIVIADTAPGFRTLVNCAGPAVGTAIQVFADGRQSTSPIAACKGYDCRTLAVPMTSGAATQARVLVSGFRHAASARDIQVTIGGKRVPVISYGPDVDPGMDQLTLAIPLSLRGLGETDLIAHVNGRVANVVRIRIGG
jgi:uncharacterized protein (TIGR03437 family)